MDYVEDCDPNAPGWNSQTCDPKTCKKIEQEPKCKSLADGYGEMTKEEFEKYKDEYSDSLAEGFCAAGNLR